VSRGQRPPWAAAFGERVIVHVDMDAFFAQVEALDHPEYRGRPLVVGGDRDSPRGVVSTCSYEARAYGIRSGLPIRRAVQLCPHAIFVRPRMARYQEMSRRIRAVLDEFSPLVEPLSIDEAFLDMTGAEHAFRDALDLGRQLKARIREATQLTASVGIAPNKFVAKLASDSGKPDGLVAVSAREMDDFLLPLPVEAVWGVGPRTAVRLRRGGMQSIADVRRRPLSDLQALLGHKLGLHVYELCLGRDPRPVTPESQAKSLGRETTFPVDVPDGPQLRAHLARLAAEVGARLRRHGMAARTVTVKIRYPDFETHTKSRSLPTPFRDDERIYREASRLLDGFALKRPLRLLGVYLSHLVPDRQARLFPEKADRVAEVMDAINRRYGARVLRRARELG